MPLIILSMVRSFNELNNTHFRGGNVNFTGPAATTLVFLASLAADEGTRAFAQETCSDILSGALLTKDTE